MFASVLINSNAKELNRVFDYVVPEEIKNSINIGSRVFVPFGKGSRLSEGYVIGFKENSEYECKEISKVEDSILTNENIELAKLMAQKYFCNVSDCIKLMLTPGTRGKENKVQDKKINVVYLKKNIEEIDFEIETGKIKSEKHKRIINFVKQNEGVTIPEIEMYTDCSRSIVNTLIRNGYLEILEKKIERDPLGGKNIEKTNNLELTDEQQIAFEKVKIQMEKGEYKSFFLYGVTGSRKN